MPKEKTLLVIGIWIILLSNFIGLATEIKNYLFIATGLVLIAMSYASNFSQKDTVENFFHAYKKSVKKPETKQEKPLVREPLIASMKKEKRTEESPEVISTPDLSNPFEDMHRGQYEPVIKVRKARTKPKPKLVRETDSAPESYPTMPVVDSSEDDDVIVISSDSDTGQGV